MLGMMVKCGGFCDNEVFRSFLRRFAVNLLAHFSGVKSFNLEQSPDCNNNFKKSNIVPNHLLAAKKFQSPEKSSFALTWE